MSINFERVAVKYLNAKTLSSGTCKEYRGTVSKWLAWGRGPKVDQISRSALREFLDWVHEKAESDGGSNAGRTDLPRSSTAKDVVIQNLKHGVEHSAVQ